jgi:uncharacterized protein (TIGR03086 family)
MSEAIDRFKHVLDGFDARVQAAPADAWGNQSPCAEWKARDVVVHVANNLRRVSGGTLPEVAEGDDIAGAWNATRDATLAMVASADLSATAQGPFGPMPLEDLLGRIISSDVLVHTWDLARAVGGDETLDAAAVTGAYSGLKPLDGMIRRPGLFDAKADAPAGADEQAEFLAFLGRKV